MKYRAPFALSLLLAAGVYPAAAQVQLGDFNLTGNGTLSAGYTGDFGNQTASDHGITFGGAGTLTGSFYNPNFLNFNIQPFLNQSRENSDYQSLTNASGVNANTAIFSGSYFPGSISFSKDINAQGNYNVPGVANFTSRGDSQVLNVAWSENVPKLPNVTVSFQDGSNDYSLYGADGDLTSSFRSIQAQANYRVAGFNINGGYRDTVSDSQIPEILGSAAESVDSDTSTVTFGISHALPFHGSFSAGANRSDVSSDSSSGQYNATLDTLNSGITFAPVTNLSFGGNFQYLDNLAASLDDAIVAAGGAVGSAPQQASHSLDLMGYANYILPSLHVNLNVTDDHRDQVYDGESFRSDSYTGTVSYSNYLLGGFLGAAVSVSRTTLSTNNQSELGANGTLNYAHDLKKWTISGTGRYSQNVQTALIQYMSSGYGYSANVSRRLGRKSRWMTTGSGAKSILNNQPGSGTFSQNYSTVLVVKWISVSGSYSRSDGNSVLTASGLQSVSVPLPAVTPSSVVLYGGHSYAGAVGINPFRGLTVNGSYAQALTDTQGDALASNNHVIQLNGYLQYQFRKMYFTAGFSKMTQSFSSSTTGPAMVGSFYFGISRWFNFL